MPADAPTRMNPMRRPFRVAWRIVSIVLLAFFIGWVLNQAALRLERDARPAGFARGVLQGALMPAALPNLLVGYDVAIYATHNNGVFYKLGYTMGVNACGALFFGMFYWRLNRWRKRNPDNAAL